MLELNHRKQNHEDEQAKRLHSLQRCFFTSFHSPVLPKKIQANPAQLAKKTKAPVDIAPTKHSHFCSSASALKPLKASGAKTCSAGSTLETQQVSLPNLQ